MSPDAIADEMRQARAQLATPPRRKTGTTRRTILAARLHALWALRLNLMAQELRRDR